MARLFANVERLTPLRRPLSSRPSRPDFPALFVCSRKRISDDADGLHAVRTAQRADATSFHWRLRCVASKLVCSFVLLQLIIMSRITVQWSPLSLLRILLTLPAQERSLVSLALHWGREGAARCNLTPPSETKTPRPSFV